MVIVEYEYVEYKDVHKNVGVLFLGRIFLHDSYCFKGLQFPISSAFCLLGLNIYPTFPDFFYI